MTGKDGRVIPAGGGGVDVEGFGRALAESPPAGQLRGELGLGTSPVIITVTRMTRHKGIPTLLKAAALVHRACPDAKFLLVGPRESEGPLAVAQFLSPYSVAAAPDGTTFRFAGVNLYWLGIVESGLRYPTHFEIDDGLATAAEMNRTVVRSFMLVSAGISIAASLMR